MDSIRTNPIGGGGANGSKKKASGVICAWLLMDTTGEAQIVEEGRQYIMRRTGLPARDLRILDPLLSYPSRILGRERAIVINLEHIKAIITSHEVLILNFKDPSVIPFVEDLQIRLLRFRSATTIQEGSVNSDETESRNLIGGSDDLKSARIDQGPSKFSFSFQNGQMVPPFEFIVLEACLESACNCLDDEARTLELEAHPALDKLASKISTLNLERVRQIKSRLVTISGRVQKVRDELENLLDDDEDMAEMYLTQKATQKHLDGSYDLSSTFSRSEENDIDDEFIQPEIDDDDRTSETSLVENDIPNHYEGDLQDINEGYHHLLVIKDSISGDSNGTINTSTITPSVISKQLDVEELEMLLEAFFLQIDGTLNNLSTLREYVDDTEDYINIILDEKQNQLLKMGVKLATATVVSNFFGNVVGTFGIQIKIELFKDDTESGRPEFWWITGGCVIGSIVMYVLAIAWCRYKGLV